MDSAKPIYKYLLQQNNQVAELVTYGKTMNMVRKKLNTVIYQYIGNDWIVQKITANEITFIVRSAQSAHRLRFQSTNILQEIRTLESCELLNNIEIKVRPESFMSDGKQKKIKGPFASVQGEQHLRALADNIDDSALKASLQRLARHLAR